MSEKQTEIWSIYRVTNRITGIVRHIPAKGAQDACASVGWDIGESHLYRLQPSWEKDGDGTYGFMVVVPCLTCPFQYAHCAKSNFDNCPIHMHAPDFTKWLTQVTQAHLCPFVGKSVSKKDHEQHQVLMTVEEAIKHLSCQ